MWWISSHSVLLVLRYGIFHQPNLLDQPCSMVRRYDLYIYKTMVWINIVLSLYSTFYYVYNVLFYTNSTFLLRLLFLSKLYRKRKYYILTRYFSNRRRMLRYIKKSLHFQKQSYVASIRLSCILRRTLSRPGVKSIQKYFATLKLKDPWYISLILIID